MASTTFQNGVTLTDDDWFNDVDFLVYDIFGDSGTTASAAARIQGGITTLGAISFTGVVSLTSVAGAAIATQSIMEAAAATDSIVSPGRLHFHPGVAKCWARFDGTATSVTAAASYGVTSITDGGTGVYTVNFSTSFSAVAAYALIPSSTADHTRLRSISAASATILCMGSAGTAEDSAAISFVAFGDFA